MKVTLGDNLVLGKKEKLEKEGEKRKEKLEKEKQRKGREKRDIRDKLI